MSRVERRAQPASWRFFHIALESLVEFTQRLRMVVEDATKHPVALRVTVDGFEGAFDKPEEIPETISRRQWKSVRSFQIELIDDGIQPSLNASFMWLHRARPVMEVTGGKQVLRNGLMVELQEIVEQLIRHEQKGRYRRLLSPFKSWQVISALLAFLGLIATVLMLLFQAHVLGA